MKPLKLIQNPSYKIIRFKHSSWVRVEHDGEMIGLCMDKESSFQLIYQHIKKNGYNCEKITQEDFE